MFTGTTSGFVGFATRIHRTHQQERSHGCRIHPQGELAEGRAGIVHRDPVPKFEDFVKNEFMPWSEKQHETHPRTHQYYRMSSKPLIASLGKLPLDGITTAYVERFKMVRPENVSPASTNRDMAALRYVLNFAIRQGYLTRNPVKGVKFLDEGPGMMRVVSHDEQKRYLDKAKAFAS